MMQLWLSSSDMRTVSEVTKWVVVDTIEEHKLTRDRLRKPHAHEKFRERVLEFYVPRSSQK